MVLITGASGFLGRNLVRFFASQDLAATYFRSPLPQDLASSVKAIQLDIRDYATVSLTFEQLSPAVVIHAAGNKNVRYCEAHPDEAYQVNTLGTWNVARACGRIGARMIYISTDLVFDCTVGDYKETDIPRPSLVYGKTKLQGEKLAAQELEEIAICRSGGAYGKGSPLLKWLSAELKAGRTVECFTDVFNTPTYAENLAEMIEVIMRRRLSGIFHTVGCERVSRFQLFRAYAHVFGLDGTLLSPVPAGDRKAELLLQADSSLKSTESAAKLGITFDSVEEGCVRLKVAGGV